MSARTPAPAPAPPLGASARACGYHELLQIVEHGCGAPPHEARALLRAILETLAETLPAETAARLGRSLPPELAPYVEAGSQPQRTRVLPRDEFLRRVMVHSEAARRRRCAVPAVVEAVVRAITAATGTALSAGRLDHRYSGSRDEEGKPGLPAS